ncbi:hypothetical protein Tco_0364578 [Tanacetum coccineum]
MKVVDELFETDSYEIGDWEEEGSEVDDFHNDNSVENGDLDDPLLDEGGEVADLSHSDSVESRDDEGTSHHMLILVIQSMKQEGAAICWTTFVVNDNDLRQRKQSDEKKESIRSGPEAEASETLSNGQVKTLKFSPDCLEPSMKMAYEVIFGD